MTKTQPGTRSSGVTRPGLRGLLTAAAVIAVLLLVADQGTVQSALLGAGSGALIAAIALGIVVVYRGSGVINVASGAMAMYAAYVFTSLNGDGELLLLAWRVDLGDPLAFIPSLLVAMVMAALLNALLYFLVFGPIANASPVSKLVASVGLLLLLQATVVLSFGVQAIPVAARPTMTAVDLPGDLVIPRAQLDLVIAVLVVSLILWALYRFTLFGLLTQASAEDGRHLMLVGRSPLMVGVGNWLFSGALIAFMSVLATPIAGTINPTTTTMLVVPALAAALLGRFTSFGWAAGGGLAIGMLQAMAQYWSAQPWFPQADNLPLPGLAESVPLILVLVALALQRRRLGGRGSLDTVRLPFAPPSRHVVPKLVVALVIGTAAFLLLSSPWRLASINTLIGIGFCLSLVVLAGFVGQVSLAQMSLAGVSAFIVANVATKLGIGFPLGPVLGALGAVLMGLVVGYAALRVRGVHLAIVTLAFGVAITALVFQNAAWSRQGSGAEVPTPTLLGWSFGPNDDAGFGDGQIPNPVFGIFCLVVVLALCWMVYGVRSSVWGRRMLAVRVNERAAAAAGVSVRNTKLIAFAASGFIVGIAGALSGYRFGVVTPEYFAVFPSLTLLAFAYMGGISSVGGAVIGGFLITNGVVFTALDQWVGISPDYTLLIGGVGLVLTVIMNPDGIAGNAAATYARLRAGTPSVDGPREQESSHPAPTSEAKKVMS